MNSWFGPKSNFHQNCPLPWFAGLHLFYCLFIDQACGLLSPWFYCLCCNACTFSALHGRFGCGQWSLFLEMSIKLIIYKNQDYRVFQISWNFNFVCKLKHLALPGLGSALANVNNSLCKARGYSQYIHFNTYKQKWSAVQNMKYVFFCFNNVGHVRSMDLPRVLSPNLDKLNNSLNWYYMDKYPPGNCLVIHLIII